MRLHLRRRGILPTLVLLTMGMSLILLASYLYAGLISTMAIEQLQVFW